MKKIQRIAAAILLVLLARAPLSAAAPELAFFDTLDTVTADGATSGGDVLFLSASRERIDWTSRIVSRLELAPADFTGLASVNGVTVTDPSIWAAVDLKTGGVTIESPSDQYQSIAVKDLELLGGTGFVYAGERLDLVVVRGQNAWLARVHDGGDADRSPPQDGQVEIALGALQRVYPTGAFWPYGNPRNGDLLIGIDAEAMTWFQVTITNLGGRFDR